MISSGDALFFLFLSICPVLAQALNVSGGGHPISAAPSPVASGPACLHRLGAGPTGSVPRQTASVLRWRAAVPLGRQTESRAAAAAATHFGARPVVLGRVAGAAAAAGVSGGGGRYRRQSGGAPGGEEGDGRAAGGAAAGPAHRLSRRDGLQGVAPVARCRRHIRWAVDCGTFRPRLSEYAGFPRYSNSVFGIYRKSTITDDIIAVCEPLHELILNEMYIWNVLFSGSQSGTYYSDDGSGEFLFIVFVNKRRAAARRRMRRAGGVEHPPLTWLLGHVTTRGKSHSKERQKSRRNCLVIFRWGQRSGHQR